MSDDSMEVLPITQITVEDNSLVFVQLPPDMTEDRMQQIAQQLHQAVDGTECALIISTHEVKLSSFSAEEMEKMGWTRVQQGEQTH